LINLLQPAIDALTHDGFHDNPIPVNVILAGSAFVFGIALVAYVAIQGKRAMKRLEEDDMETASILQSIAEDESEYDYNTF
jgi:hypothetical protein